MKVEAEGLEKMYKLRERRMKEEYDYLFAHEKDLSSKVSECEKERIAQWDKEAERRLKQQRLLQQVNKKAKNNSKLVSHTENMYIYIYIIYI